MDDTTLCSIGELSRRTGLSVRTIRFYSDSGVVTPATRSPAGHRRYDRGALPRLELVRTLREWGLDLPTIRRVLDRELSLARVAAAHADAVDVQIRALRLRRSVLRAVAGRGSSPEETLLMHRLTRLSGEERRRLVDGFLDSAFGADTDTDTDTGAAGTAAAAMARAAAPDLPDDPTDEQVAAWVELAALVGEEDFRARLRRAALREAAGPGPGVEREAGEELMDHARREVARARQLDMDPAGDRAAPIVDDLVRRFAARLSRTPDAAFRAWLAREFAAAHDPRVDRYWRLVWIVNGWQVVPA
ncbi:hypothetical protein SZN_17827, partial [Streptomyces zinciresistens K42]